VLKTELRRL